MENRNVFKEITNEDIYKQIESLAKSQSEILAHAQYTNGKIADAIKQIEMVKKRSLGVWIAQHPFKFAGMVMIFFSFVISDIRHPLLEIVKNLFI